MKLVTHTIKNIFSYMYVSGVFCQVPLIACIEPYGNGIHPCNTPTTICFLKLCGLLFKYIYIFFFHIIHNNSKTHKFKCYKLVVHGDMFRPHCGHLQANLYKSSALNVRTIWDPIVCTIILYVE
jgi:hypothetical protein